MHLCFVYVFYRPVYVGPYSEDSITRFSCSGPRLVVQWLVAAFMHDVILLEVQADVIGEYRSFVVASDAFLIMTTSGQCMKELLTPAFPQTSQEIFITSLDSGGWSGFFFI